MIVTGFVDLQPHEPGVQRARPASGYISNARWLLGSTAPMVIFCEEQYEPEFAAMRPPGSVTVWERAVVPDASESIARGIARSHFRWNPLKDTPRYFALMRQKIAWLARGAELARGPVTWVDLALPGDLLDPPSVLLEGVPDRIRLAELSHVPRHVRHDRSLFYADHYWPVAGGLIRGTLDDLRWLDERIAEEWAWCIANEFAATDEMMLGFVRFQHPERFDVYYADHSTLVQNWSGIRGSQWLIMQMALRAVADGCPEEAQRRFAALAAAR